jgi:hypothetical protein
LFFHATLKFVSELRVTAAELGADGLSYGRAGSVIDAVTDGVPPFQMDVEAPTPCDCVAPYVRFRVNVPAQIRVVTVCPYPLEKLYPGLPETAPDRFNVAEKPCP